MAQKSSSNFQSIHFGKNVSKQMIKPDKQEKEGRHVLIWVNKFCNFFASDRVFDFIQLKFKACGVLS